jgi:hypothetical protein
MKSKFVLALAASMAVAGSVNAADLYNGMKDEYRVGASPSFPNISTNGFYVDFGIGGAVETSIIKSTTNKIVLSPSGFVGEVRTGYDWKLSRSVFFGPYASVNYDWAEGQGIGYAVGGELGIEWGNARLKGFVGYAGQHSSQSPMTLDGFSRDLSGLEVGAETQIFWNKNLYTFVRVKDDMYGKFNVAATNTQDAYSVDANVVTGLIGLGFKTN